MWNKITLSLILVMAISPAQAKGDVVVSIAPLHSLVQSVMGDTGKAILLQKGGVSPHTLNLKPSHIENIARAKVVFYMHPDFEQYLANVQDLTEGATYALFDTPNLLLLPLREEHHHEEDEHTEEAHHHDIDLHLWLDTDNAKKIASYVAKTLGDTFPENRAAYRANTEALMTRLSDLDEDIKHSLIGANNKHYIVFHDAYQYFERRYHLQMPTVMHSHENISPSASRMTELHRQIASGRIRCAFQEPQFSSRIADRITEGTDIPVRTLDPLGAGLPAGKDLYFQMMRQLANNIGQCLNDK